MLVIGQCARHATVIGQYASSAQDVLAHFAGLMVVFYYENEYQIDSFFFLKFCYSFDLLVTGLRVASRSSDVVNHYDKSV